MLEMQWGCGSSSVQGHVSPALHVSTSDVAELVVDKALISMGINLSIINECHCPDLLYKGGRDVCWGFVFERLLPLEALAGGWCPSQPCFSCPEAQEVSQAPWGSLPQLKPSTLAVSFKEPRS